MSSATPDPLFIGLMSGTSMDGIDAALVRLGESHCEMLANHSHAYSQTLRRSLLDAAQSPDAVCIDELGRLDGLVGEHFRNAALELLAISKTPAASVRAIGSHGQTIRHLPLAVPPVSLQIGNPNTIASGTGIVTVADFRRRDLALGGQGAPLAPAFHEWLFASKETPRVVLNIGGMANVTVLPGGDGSVVGFDTGPGNTLMDAWVRKHKGEPFDREGQWAASGKPDEALVQRMLADPYFSKPPPKSTGFEHFSLQWLAEVLTEFDITAADVQASLLELTVRSIGETVDEYSPGSNEIAVCGGGVNNEVLMRSLRKRLAPKPLISTATLGVDPEWVEAAAFAWLASRTVAGKTGNLPSVTGASRREVLGAIYPVT